MEATSAANRTNQKTLTQQDWTDAKYKFLVREEHSITTNCKKIDTSAAS